MSKPSRRNGDRWQSDRHINLSQIISSLTIAGAILVWVSVLEGRIASIETTQMYIAETLKSELKKLNDNLQGILSRELERAEKE